MSQSVNGGGSTAFAYDAFGNGTSSRDKTGAVTTSAYDAADRLRTLTPPSGSFVATFSFDALGRIATRSVATTPTPTLDTYAYAATAETVARITTTGGASATLTSVVDPAGSRLTTSTGSIAYALPDLHGSTAALENASRVLTAAYRFDGWGQTIATYPTSSPPANPFRYRGLLDVSSDATNALYDMGARFYSPGLGTFTQLDSVRGSAEDPVSMNRFLYAEANPATLIDPDGHATYQAGQICPYGPGECGTWTPQTYSAGSTSTGAGAGGGPSDPGTWSPMSLDAWNSLSSGEQFTYALTYGADASEWLEDNAYTDEILDNPAAFFIADFSILLRDLAAYARAGRGVFIENYLGPEQLTSYLGRSDANLAGVFIAALAAAPAIGNMTDSVYPSQGGREARGLGTSGLPPSASGFRDPYHGNSALSLRPQHVYVIYEIRNGVRSVYKYGISGQPLNVNGSSPRANRQVRGLNKLEEGVTYEAKIVGYAPNRQAALDMEFKFVLDATRQDPLHVQPPGNRLPNVSGQL